MSNENAGLPNEKVSVACECGKRYRVSLEKAKTKLTCKVCGKKIRVPRAAAVSDRSRNDILAEFGIDSDVAKAKYKQEKLRETPQPRVYKCVRCENKIRADEIKGAYVKGELLCKGCRDSAEVVDRRAEADKEESERKGRRPAVEGKVLRSKQQREAALLSLGYGVFFFLGIFAPAWVVFDVKLVGAISVALLVGVAGGLAVYARRRGLAYL